MIPIGKKYGIDAIFALTKAEDVWHGVEKCLYGNGENASFLQIWGSAMHPGKADQPRYPDVRKNDELKFKLGKLVFGIQVKRPVPN